MTSIRIGSDIMREILAGPVPAVTIREVDWSGNTIWIEPGETLDLTMINLSDEDVEVSSVAIFEETDVVTDRVDASLTTEQS